MQHYGDNVIPVVPTDIPMHTADHPFCGLDPACPCYEDPDNIRALSQAIEEGLLTPEEATEVIRGRTI
jgi:hypothetical protein